MSRRTLEQELIQLSCFHSMYILGGNLSSLVDLDDWAKFRDIWKKEKEKHTSVLETFFADFIRRYYNSRGKGLRARVVGRMAGIDVFGLKLIRLNRHSRGNHGRGAL